MSAALTLGLPVIWNGFVVPRPLLTEVASIMPIPEYISTVSSVGTLGEAKTHSFSTNSYQELILMTVNLKKGINGLKNQMNSPTVSPYL